MTRRPPSGTTAELDDSALDAMVEPHPDRGRPYARLTEYGTPIWVLINRMGEPTQENLARVAWEYSLPDVAIQAAIRYYERNKKYIDAVIIINNEPFGLNEQRVASYCLDEHVGQTLVPPLVARGHDALATRQAGNHGLTDPRQLLFARHHGRIMVTFNDVDFAMLHETLVLWAALGTLSGSPLHAAIAVLPSSSRVAPERLVGALDELPRLADDWVPATGWEEVVVVPFAPQQRLAAGQGPHALKKLESPAARRRSPRRPS